MTNNAPFHVLRNTNRIHNSVLPFLPFSVLCRGGVRTRRCLLFASLVWNLVPCLRPFSLLRFRRRSVQFFYTWRRNPLQYLSLCRSLVLTKCNDRVPICRTVNPLSSELIRSRTSIHPLRLLPPFPFHPHRRVPASVKCSKMRTHIPFQHPSPHCIPPPSLRYTLRRNNLRTLFFKIRSQLFPSASMLQASLPMTNLCNSVLAYPLPQPSLTPRSKSKGRILLVLNLMRKKEDLPCVWKVWK